MKNEFQASGTTSLFAAENWTADSHATLSVADIHDPWRSVYGFSINAARLAANQPLVLHCREDEVFAVLAKLNSLLESPAVLRKALGLLRKLKQVTEQRVAHLTALEGEPISDEELSEIVQAVEEYLTTDHSSQTVLDRLEEILTPNRPADELAGLQTMLARLEEAVTALANVKDQGFRVVAQRRRRQPERPALEAQRHAPIVHQGQPTDLPAGFLLPARYHRTLWAYLIVRSDSGQSAIWN